MNIYLDAVSSILMQQRLGLLDAKFCSPDHLRRGAVQVWELQPLGLPAGDCGPVPGRTRMAKNLGSLPDTDNIESRRRGPGFRPVALVPDDLTRKVLVTQVFYHANWRIPRQTLPEVKPFYQKISWLHPDPEGHFPFA